MNVLVTGGAGFIGSNLTELLLSQGHVIRAVDNLSTGRIENIQQFQGNSNYRFFQHTVTDRAFMEEHVSWADHVYHLAAPVGVKYIMDNPVLTILDNVRGVDVMLELANKHGKRIMIASTSEVYGKSLDLLDPTGERKLTEGDYRIEGSTRNHRWAYANTKALDEFLSFAYHMEHGTEVVVIRFFNTVGPRQLPTYGMVIPNFVQRAVRGEDLVIFGTGKQRRSFLHVEDAVRGVTALMQTGKGVGDVFNVGNPIEITIRDLAEKVIALSGSNSQIVYKSYKDAYGVGFEDMDRRTADITKLKEAIGFEIKYDLDAILADTIRYHKSELALKS